MAEVNPCAWLEARGDHHARNARHVLSALVGVSGVLGLDDLQVTAVPGTPDMAVRIRAGAGVLEGTQQTRQGAYEFVNDGDVQRPVAASEPSGRHDLWVAQVLDEEYAGAESRWRIHSITGTAAAEPDDPQIPDNCFPLARVRVPALADQITNDDIDDLRPNALLRAQLLMGVDLDDWIPTQDGHLVTLGHMRDYVDEPLDVAEVTAGTASTLTLNVPDGVRNARVVGWSRSDEPSDHDRLWIHFNGTTATTRWHRETVQGSSEPTISQESGDFLWTGWTVGGNGGDNRGLLRALFSGLRDSPQCTFDGRLSSYPGTSGATQWRRVDFSGTTLAAPPITSLVISLEDGDFVAGTRFELLRA